MVPVVQHAMSAFATRIVLPAALSVVFVGGSAAAQSLYSHMTQLAGAAVPVKAPVAFLDACQRYSWLCNHGAKAANLLDPERVLEVARSINRKVNRTVSQVSDFENYGKSDFWTLPLWGSGDCEDLALDKYRMLLDAGIDSHDLSMAIALNGRGENHAVLVLHHRSGDLVLDNLSDWILPWRETGYRFLAVQMRDDKFAWELTPDQGRDSRLLAEK